MRSSSVIRTRRHPEGVVCLALAGGLQVSTVRMDKVFRDPANGIDPRFGGGRA